VVALSHHHLASSIAVPRRPLPSVAPRAQVAFVATGESKAPVLRHIFDGSVPFEESLPSARIRQRDTELPTWFVDTPAAAQH
jgi:6-phosphogluconolactonase/glucosamine-6-phosphate isomerase/deaminase